MNKLKPMIVNISVLILCYMLFAIYNTFFIIHQTSVIKIRGGQSIGAIVRDLEIGGVLNFFNKKIFLRFVDGSFRAGHYRVYNGETIFAFSRRVKRGDSEMCTITFIPGKTAYFYTKQLNANDDFYGEILQKPTEGEILPESYKYKCQTSKQKVFEYAKSSTRNTLDAILKDFNFANSHLKNANEVLIMASIIEKETSIVDEMPVISSVFKNRMKIGMKLQTDPTVIYQITGGTGVLEEKLTLDDLKSAGAWNTYVISGLPLTPIASPSVGAIKAAINPSETDYIFFVASGTGGHVFAKTYKEHLANVEKYRKIQSGAIQHL